MASREQVVVKSERERVDGRRESCARSDRKEAHSTRGSVPELAMLGIVERVTFQLS